MDKRVTLPGIPGYTANAEGEVFTSKGIKLKYDKGRDRVRLMVSGHQVRIHRSDIISMVASVEPEHMKDVMSYVAEQVTQAIESKRDKEVQNESEVLDIDDKVLTIHAPVKYRKDRRWYEGRVRSFKSLTIGTMVTVERYTGGVTFGTASGEKDNVIPTDIHLIRFPKKTDERSALERELDRTQVMEFTPLNKTFQVNKKWLRKTQDRFMSLNPGIQKEALTITSRDDLSKNERTRRLLHLGIPERCIMVLLQCRRQAVKTVQYIDRKKAEKKQAEESTE
jgi:hypothetical protein